MSKPLIFVLQLAGAMMMLFGFGDGQAGVGIAGLDHHQNHYQEKSPIHAHWY